MNAAHNNIICDKNASDSLDAVSFWYFLLRFHFPHSTDELIVECVKAMYVRVLQNNCFLRILLSVRDSTEMNHESISSVVSMVVCSFDSDNEMNKLWTIVKYFVNFIEFD